MRNSKKRNIILDILQNDKGHMTADRVYEEARKIVPNISLGTVYRNLGQLVEHNILRTISVNGVVHYDAFLHNHQHFLCSTCNRVYDIEVNTEEFVAKIDAKTNHKIDRCQVQLFGICEECQNN
jgi:Fe2+ or Zn2+ uptake regulation protein